MIQIKLRNFGPIQEADIRYRPLTLFIGPNGVGKSYLALLFYSIHRALVPFIFGRHPLRRLPRYFWRMYDREGSDQFEKWMRDLRKEDKKKLGYTDFPEFSREFINKSVGKIIEDFALNLGSELKRCFASELSDLISSSAKEPFQLEIKQDNPQLNVTIEIKGKALRLLHKSFSLDGIVFDFSEYPAEIIVYQAVSQLFGNLYRSAYYLPAARSGILQSHKAIAGAMVSRAPLVGIEDIEIPKLSGVVADFISILLQLDRREKNGSSGASVARFLEMNAIGGKIDVAPVKTRSDYPEVFYQLGRRKYPMHRSSSMISEIAPIILFMKYVITKGDLFIIEEPEAHLHPDNQRILAQAIVKMIRSGIRVLLTTHSDYFLQQLSNFVLLNKADRKKFGYDENDYISAEEVAGYLLSFKKKPNISVSKELHVSDVHGIPDEEFLVITDALYNETVRLEQQMQH